LELTDEDNELEDEEDEELEDEINGVNELSEEA